MKTLFKAISRLLAFLVYHACNLIGLAFTVLLLFVTVVVYNLAYLYDWASQEVSDEWRPYQD